MGRLGSSTGSRAWRGRDASLGWQPAVEFRARHSSVERDELEAVLDDGGLLQPAARANHGEGDAVVRGERRAAEDGGGVVEDMSGPEGAGWYAGVVEAEEEPVEKHVGTEAGSTGPGHQQ